MADTKKLTPKKCLEVGGHCFIRTGNIDKADGLLRYEEICKHCDTIRWATPRPPFEYDEN